MPRNSEDIALEVLAERVRQERKGWTPEHDRQHGPFHLLELAAQRLPDTDWWGGEPVRILSSRKDLIEAAALIIAAVEVMDHAA